MQVPESEYAPFYGNYIKTVSDDVIADLKRQLTDMPVYFRNIPLDKADFAYAAGKWTIKEVIGHIIDTERIMAYRALRIARADSTPLPGFEENDYARNARYHERNMTSLADEFTALRTANMFLFESFNEEELKRMGLSSGKMISVRALLFIVAGHLNHHKRILEERYL